ncbi:MAG: hypothetical protein IJ400_06105 [Clostridia bacterium]|nr:hypothetical protein [Clostridia bacterium]
MLKKILSLLLVAIMIFSLTSCLGEYQVGVNQGGNNENGNNTGDVDDELGTDDSYVPPTLNGDPTDDFVVTLYADGVPYSPRTEMYAYWNDGSSIHTAKFDSNGVARIDGLDGDYRVTLTNVPNEYTYNPNGNMATNDDRSIVVNLYTLNQLAGGGTGLYDCYTFRKTGVYCATLNSAEDGIYFQYSPEGMGTYSIESWADVTADDIDPDIDVYIGSSQWKAYEKTITDGGPIGSYTINFVHEVKIASENISAGGQAVYTFVVRAESKNDKYPITVTFAVKRNGDFELPSSGNGTGKTMAIPTYDFTDFDVNDHEYGNNYKIAYPEYQYEGLTYVFDESRVKLWEKAMGGDDFYHLYDEEKYADTNGYGPILYANITTSNRFLDINFNRIEYNANGEIINAALSANGVNYKHLIEGYTQLSTVGKITNATYYCVDTCPCHDSTDPVGWACTKECTKCATECRRIDEKLIGFEGYQAYVNSDGVVPVTKDIKDFLLAYTNKELFFWDGRGTKENVLISNKYFQAIGDSGWLFGCCYYEEKQ